MACSPADVEDASLLQTYRKWRQLQSQLQQYTVKLRSAQEGLPLSSDEPDILKERISELNNKLLQLSTDGLIRDSMLQTLQMGHVLYTHAFPAGDVATTDTNPDLRSALSKTTSLVSDVMRLQKEVKDIDLELADLRKENRELNADCRELLQTNEQRKIDRLRDLSRPNEDQCKVMQKKNEEIVEKLELVQNSFLGLIHGSGVNWDDNDELRKIVRSLGQPIDDLLVSNSSSNNS